MVLTESKLKAALLFLLLTIAQTSSNFVHLTSAFSGKLTYSVEIQSDSSLSGTIVRQDWIHPPVTNQAKYLDNHIYVGQRLGDKPETVKPDGNGAYTEWDGQHPDVSTQYNAVNDISQDADESYIYSSTVGDRSLFSVTDPTEHPELRYIMVNVYAKAVNGDNSIKLMIRTYDCDYYGEVEPLSNSYTQVVHSWNVNPYTEDNWTQDEVENLEIGVYVNDIDGGSIRVTQIFVHVFYFRYRVDRGYLTFDTSVIPNDATVLSANLSLTLEHDASTSDFDLNFASEKDQLMDASDLTWDACQVYEGIFINTEVMKEGERYNHTISSSSINKGGYTQFRLFSATEDKKPEDSEYVYFGKEAKSAPTLSVLYQLPDDQTQDAFVIPLEGLIISLAVIILILYSSRRTILKMQIFH